MQTTGVTKEMIQDWRRIYDIFHSSMKLNRKTGIELNTYFKSKYTYHVYNDETFKRVVELSIMEHEYSRDKLSGRSPAVNTYRIGDILVGIDVTSGEFHVECEDMKKAEPIYDDLFLYRGLDAEDLKNYFLVAEYVKLKQKTGSLDQ